MSSKIFFLSCCISLSYPMQQQPTLTYKVQKATTVHIDIESDIINLLYASDMNCPINAITTISDIKKNIESTGTIPVNMQRIHAVWAVPLTWGLIEKDSRNLHDDETVKSVMNEFNTNRFRVYLQAACQQQRTFELKQFLPSKPIVNFESKAD